MGLRDRDLVPQRKKKKKASVSIVMALALLAGWGIRMAVHQFRLPVQVSESAMTPALPEGTVVTVHRQFEPSDLTTGRLVWIRHPLNQRHRMIRRIAAIENDRVQVRMGSVIVNGNVVRKANHPLSVGESEQEEAGSRDPQSVQASYFDRDEFTLQAGQYYVLADREGLDSRHFGPVPAADILGILPE